MIHFTCSKINFLHPFGCKIVSECPQPFPTKLSTLKIASLLWVEFSQMHPYTFVLLTNNHTRKCLLPYPHLSVSQKQDISDSTIQCFIARTLCCTSVQNIPQGSSTHDLPQRTERQVMQVSPVSCVPAVMMHLPKPQNSEKMGAGR